MYTVQGITWKNKESHVWEFTGANCQASADLIIYVKKNNQTILEFFCQCAKTPCRKPAHRYKNEGTKRKKKRLLTTESKLLQTFIFHINLCCLLSRNYSFDIGVFSIKISKILHCRLPDDCLMTVWQLPDDCLTIAWHQLILLTFK